MFLLPTFLLSVTGLAKEYIVVGGGDDPNSNSVAVYDFYPNNKTWVRDETPVKGMALWMQLSDKNPMGQMKAFGVGHTKSWSAGFVQEWALESAKDWRQAGSVPAGGAGDCHFVLSPNGQYGYVAGYNTGQWHMLDLYGSLGAKIVKSIQFPACPSTNNTLIGPKAGVAREHETVLGGRYWVDGQYQKEMVYIMGVGCDVIHRVGTEEDGSFYKRYPDIEVPCRGPRHMVMHPVFDSLGAIVCEEEDVVLLVNFHLPQADEAIEPDWLHKLPLAGFKNTPTALHHGAAILWHPNGRFLYASSRSGVPGEGRITAYKLDPIGSIFKWEFTRIQDFKPAGQWPRGVAMHPRGFIMAVVDKLAQTLQMVDVDEKTGLLSDCANGMKCVYNTTVTQPVFVDFFSY